MEQTGVNPFEVFAHGAFLNGQGVEGFSSELTGVGNWDPLSVLTPKYSATTIGTSQSFQESTDQYISGASISIFYLYFQFWYRVLSSWASLFNCSSVERNFGMYFSQRSKSGISNRTNG